MCTVELITLIVLCFSSVVFSLSDRNSTVHGSLSYKYTFTAGDLCKPRIQWNENRGYCGEVSTISAALSYGAYFSQYDIRSITSKYKDNAQTAGELLINVNDQYTATEIALSSEEWNNLIRDTQRFLVWIKNWMIQGKPVTIGVYMNHYLFYGDNSPNAGDSTYDHIVTVYSVSSNFNEIADNKDGTLLYHEDDMITISDHALWNPRIANQPQYFYSYLFKDFQGNRRQANAADGNLYTLPDSTDIGNCGIVHTGIIGAESDSNQLVPVKVETDINYETPEIGYLSNTRPKSIPVTLSITVGSSVSNIKQGQTYHLYKYNDEKKIPNSNFNANADKSVVNWTLVAEKDGQVFSVTDKIMSNEKAIYRCVSATAP